MLVSSLVADFGRPDLLMRHLLRCASITHSFSKSNGIALRGGNILFCEGSTSIVLRLLERGKIGWRRMASVVDEDRIPITVTSHTLADMWRSGVVLAAGRYPVEV